MSDQSEGAGASRSATVRDPSFVERLEELPTDEIRRRRDQALAEREFQSYLRRLVQVRQDLLEAERARRRAGGASESVVERLKTVLAEGPQGPGRGEALRLTLSEDDVAEAARRADSVFGQAGLQELEAMTDEDLDAALSELERAEREVSEERSEVLRVHDRLQDELKRRYREDPSQIPVEL